MYPRIPWDLVSNPLGYAEHTFGTTGLEDMLATAARKTDSWVLE